MPTISDVSTVDEWRDVAEEIVGKNGGINWSATILDWPGLGYSDRPKLDYNADVMEKFLVDFVTAPDSPIASFVAGVCLSNFTQHCNQIVMLIYLSLPFSFWFGSKMLLVL